MPCLCKECGEQTTCGETLCDNCYQELCHRVSEENAAKKNIEAGGNFYKED